MSYFLIILIVFVALSPLISAMPSRRQRKIADLRQAAAMSGLYVKLRDIPRGERLGERAAFYGRKRLREHKAAVHEVLLYREDDCWSTALGRWPEARLNKLTALPGGVSMLEETAAGIGVFWGEEGETADVLVLNTVLKGLLEGEDLSP